MMDITIILLYLLAFLLIYQFVGYPSLMAMVALKTKQKDQGKDCSFISANLSWQESLIINPFRKSVVGKMPN